MTSDVAGSEHSAFSGVGVLVVEDEAIISFLIEDLLRELGCREV